jgi:hypothetical protein
MGRGGAPTDRVERSEPNSGPWLLPLNADGWQNPREGTAMYCQSELPLNAVGG